MRCRKCMDGKCTNNHSSDWSRSVVISMGYGAVGMDHWHGHYDSICGSHSLQFQSLSGLLQITRPYHRQEELLLHGCCQSQSGWQNVSTLWNYPVQQSCLHCNWLHNNYIYKHGVRRLYSLFVLGFLFNNATRDSLSLA